jgi:hypothetical protein
MKTTKTTIAIVLMLVMTTANAQSIFFPTQTGTVLIYELKDAKGKVEGGQKTTIKNIEGSGSNMTISYAFQSLDKNRKPTTEEVFCKIVVKDDVIILDMTELFAGMQTDPSMKIEITGMPAELPHNLQPGQTLKDAEMTMTMDMGVMKIKTEMKITDGKCLAIEEVATSAGKFRCHKVTQTVTTTAMGRSVKMQTFIWYAPGIGQVKTETYDEKGKLQNTMELVSKS